MNLDDRIKAFANLGTLLKEFLKRKDQTSIEADTTGNAFQVLNDSVRMAHQKNAWFTESNIKYSFSQWSQLLTFNNLIEWTNNYNFESQTPKKVAIIMAGNIPLVGFHDFLSVLICGHHVIVKQSSNDDVLLNTLCQLVFEIEPRFSERTEFTDGQLTNFEAVIATGSNNTARYFEYYFKDVPSIIRKNRTSVAVLSGNESTETLEALSEDIFRYYGLGCRNVSKLYVPQDYNFDAFFNAIYKWHPIIHEHKYANNYDYNKAVYLMSEFDMLDNGFLVLKQDEQLTSPIATLNYEFYNDRASLNSHLDSISEDIQCIVSSGFRDDEVSFGTTQQPGLMSYADGVDTVEFLLTI